MGTLKYIRHTDGGMDYMRNAVNYVSNGHGKKYPVYSPNVNLSDAFNQFYMVRQYFGKISGNPVFHFIVSFSTRSTWGDNYHRALDFSRWLADYFAGRYQVIYSVHKKYRYNKQGNCVSIYHAHILINSVSYIDGKMFAGNKSDIYSFLEYIKRMTRDKNWTVIDGSNSSNNCDDDDDINLVDPT